MKHRALPIDPHASRSTTIHYFIISECNVIALSVHCWITRLTIRPIRSILRTKKKVKKIHLAIIPLAKLRD